MDYPLARKRMIESQILARGIRDPGVIRAMAKIPRHLFVEEALQGFAGPVVVMTNQADQVAVESLVRERGGQVTVRTDPAVQGGVRASSPDGRYVVTNTLASRSERARPALAAQVARTLWE